MKLNIIGLISAILAFIAIVLPWYSMSLYTITVNRSLLDFVTGGLGSLLGGSAAPPLIIVALPLIIVGGLLGLFGSFIIGRKGKMLLMVGMLLVMLAPVVFAAGLAGSGLPLLGSFGADQYAYAVYVSFGFFLAFVAAFLMAFSARKHPMEVGAVPFAPAPPPPPPPS